MNIYTIDLYIYQSLEKDMREIKMMKYGLKFRWLELPEESSTLVLKKIKDNGSFVCICKLKHQDDKNFDVLEISNFKAKQKSFQNLFEERIKEPFRDTCYYSKRQLKNNFLNNIISILG